MASVHDVGDSVRCEVTFTSTGDVPANPDTVVFTMREPSGTETVYTFGVGFDVESDSTGVFHVDWTATESGVHQWVFVGTGDVSAPAASGFYVNTVPVTDLTAWPVTRSCLPALPALTDTPTWAELDAYEAAAVAQDNAVELASQVVWALSGRQYGLTEVTARPCSEYAQGFGYLSRLRVLEYSDVLDYGTWMDIGCGCVGSCSVSGPRVVHLPGPVHSVTAVTIADVELSSDDYRLEGDALYRVSGASWPRQNLGAPLSEPGTWSVTYLRGIPAPRGVAALTGGLAREFVAACTEDMECRLPRTVTGSSRRGVSYDFDPSKLLAAGKTGLPEVDMWLASVNPNKLTAAPEVF